MSRVVPEILFQSLPRFYPMRSLENVSTDDESLLELMEYFLRNCTFQGSISPDDLIALLKLRLDLISPDRIYDNILKHATQKETQLAVLISLTFDSITQQEGDQWNNLLSIKGYYKKILKRGNPTKQFEILTSGINSAAYIIGYIIKNHQNNPWLEWLFEALVDTGIKWPTLASDIFKYFSKDRFHLSSLLRLVPSLKSAMDSGHVNSIKQYILLLLTGLAEPDIPQDNDLFLETLNKLPNDSDSSDFLFFLAEALRKGTVATLLNAADSEKQIKNSTNFYLACCVYEKIQDVDDKYIKENSSKILNDIEFQFEVAEHHFNNGNYFQAMSTYESLINISDQEYSLFERLELRTDKFDTINKIDIACRKRIIHCWELILNNLIDNPSKNSDLCFQLAEYFVTRDIRLSLRLFKEAVSIDPSLWGDPLCMDIGTQLICQNEFSEAVQLLRKVPNGENYQQAQSLLAFCDQEYLDECSSDTSPLLSRLNIIEILLTQLSELFSNARVGRDELQEHYNKLKNEYNCLSKKEDTPKKERVDEKTEEIDLSKDCKVSPSLRDYATINNINVSPYDECFVLSVLVHMCAYNRLNESNLKAILESSNQQLSCALQEIITHTLSEGLDHLRYITLEVLSLENLMNLALDSGNAAIMIINTPQLRTIISAQSKEIIINLFGQICSLFPEVADFIFTEFPRFSPIPVSYRSEDEDSDVDEPKKYYFNSISNDLVLESGASLRLSKILTCLYRRAKEQGNLPTWFTGQIQTQWIQRILKNQTPHSIFALLSAINDEFVEKLIILHILQHYKDDILYDSALLEACKQRPHLISYFVKYITKTDNRREYLSQLADVLIDQVRECNPSSLEAYVFLSLTGYAGAKVPFDLNKILEICDQLLALGRIEAVIIIAEAFAYGEISETFNIQNGSSRYHKIPMQIMIAYDLFNKVSQSNNSQMQLRANSNLQSPQFLVNLGYCYQTQLEYDKALDLYQFLCDLSAERYHIIKEEIAFIQSPDKNHLKKMLHSKEVEQNEMRNIHSQALFEKARVTSEMLPIVRGKSDQALPFSDKHRELGLHRLPKFCFQLALHYHRKNRLDVACGFFIKATDADKTVWENPLCINLAMSLIYQRKFAEARALLRKVPHGTNYVSAQNILAFGQKINCDDVVLLDSTKPILSELDEAEYKLPLYEKANKSGHVEATLIYPHLLTEYQALKEPNKTLPKYAPGFVSQLAAAFPAIDKDETESKENQP